MQLTATYFTTSRAARFPYETPSGDQSRSLQSYGSLNSHVPNVQTNFQTSDKFKKPNPNCISRTSSFRLGMVSTESKCIEVISSSRYPPGKEIKIKKKIKENILLRDEFLVCGPSGWRAKRADKSCQRCV